MGILFLGPMWVVEDLYSVPSSADRAQSGGCPRQSTRVLPQVCGYRSRVRSCSASELGGRTQRALSALRAGKSEKPAAAAGLLSAHALQAAVSSCKRRISCHWDHGTVRRTCAEQNTHRFPLLIASDAWRPRIRCRSRPLHFWDDEGEKSVSLALDMAMGMLPPGSMYVA